MAPESLELCSSASLHLWVSASFQRNRDGGGDGVSVEIPAEDRTSHPFLHGRDTPEHSTGVVLHGEQAGFCGNSRYLKTTDPRPQLHEVNRVRCGAGAPTELLLTQGLKQTRDSSWVHKAHLCGSQPGRPHISECSPGVRDTMCALWRWEGSLHIHPLFYPGKWNRAGEAACGTDRTDNE